MNPEDFGYYVRARNWCFTPEMFDGYKRICEKHGCVYRIEPINDKEVEIIFFKHWKAGAK